MNNISTWDNFRNKKNKTTIEVVNESAQLIDDVWKVRTRFEIPVSLVNAYIKKVKDETGKNIRETYSDVEVAEEIASYVKSAFMNISNLPTSIIVGEKQEQSPSVQVQDSQPQTQEEGQEGQTQAQEGGQEGQAQGQPQGQPQAPAQGQPQGQVQNKAEKTAAQVPAQEI